MEKYAPKFSKVLLTPDPHYIPGYAGYCPQLKYNAGRSYGPLTAQLLTCPEVRHSNHLVLHNGQDPPEAPGGPTSTGPPGGVLKKTIPGYTGFIPRSQNYFACTYSETCNKALSEFQDKGRSKIRRQTTVLPAVMNNDRPGPPLKAFSNTASSSKPLKPFVPPGKPYSMSDDDPNKYFISGFTGHVPKSHFVLGKGYPIATNEALIQFRREQQQSGPACQGFPERRDSTAGAKPDTHPSSRGVVPAFTGHIPGYRFMYGHTFGQLSQDALEKSGSRRTLQAQ